MKLFNYSFIVGSLVAFFNLVAMNEPEIKCNVDNLSRQQSVLLVRSTLAGAGAGIAEVAFVGHLCSYFVNQSILGNRFSLKPLQWKKSGSISLNPRHMYSGVGMNLASMAPITGIQNALTAQFASWFKEYTGKELSGIQLVLPPVFAGAVAALLVATPTERIPNYMQRVVTHNGSRLSSWQATKELISKHGITTPWRGVSSTALRDGLFTVGYKTLPGAIHRFCSPLIGDGSVSKMSSSIVAGLITAVATQPFQVVARHMQNNETVSHSLSAVRELYNNEGVGGLWKGGIPRGIRVVVAIPVLSFVEKKLSEVMNDCEEKND